MDYRGYFRKPIVDGDNALVQSDLTEYYLDNGALFQVVGCLAEELAQDETIEIEICSGDTPSLRVFGVNISTIANEFRTALYELPPRTKANVPGTPGTDSRDARIFAPNRRNIKAFPLDMVYLMTSTGKYGITAWDSGKGDYAVDDLVRHNAVVYKCTTINTAKEPGVSTDWENDWDETGSVVDIKQYILEEAGGQQAADTGIDTARSTMVEINTESHNYLFTLEHLNTEAKKYGAGLKLGVAALIE